MWDDVLIGCEQEEELERTTQFRPTDVATWCPVREIGFVSPDLPWMAQTTWARHFRAEQTLAAADSMSHTPVSLSLPHEGCPCLRTKSNGRPRAARSSDEDEHMMQLDLALPGPWVP